MGNLLVTTAVVSVERFSGDRECCNDTLDEGVVLLQTATTTFKPYNPDAKLPEAQRIGNATIFIPLAEQEGKLTVYEPATA